MGQNHIVLQGILWKSLFFLNIFVGSVHVEEYVFQTQAPPRDVETYPSNVCSRPNWGTNKQSKALSSIPFRDKIPTVAIVMDFLISVEKTSLNFHERRGKLEQGITYFLYSEEILVAQSIPQNH